MNHVNRIFRVAVDMILNSSYTNTFYNRVTLYIRNEPFHSASLSDYDAYALPTKASHYAPMNSSNTLTIVDTTSLFSKGNPTSSRNHTQWNTQTQSETTTNQPSRVPLVITYNPSLRSISSIIHTNIHTYKLYSRPKKAFQRIQKERKKKLNDNIIKSKIK